MVQLILFLDRKTYEREENRIQQRNRDEESNGHAKKANGRDKDRENRHSKHSSSSRPRHKREKRDRSVEIVDEEEEPEEKPRSSASLWVMSGLVVRVVDKRYKGGDFYRQKMVVVDAAGAEHCELRDDRGRIHSEYMCFGQTSLATQVCCWF